MKKITKNLRNLTILLALTLTAFSTNAQSGWQQVYTGSGWIELMTFVPGTDNQWQTGWAVTGSDAVIKTTDGGDTWTVYNQSEATFINGIAFLDEDNGYMCSANGEIVKSTDGGETWTLIYENASDWFGQMSFKDNMNGAIIGTPSKYTSDGGNTWTSSTTNGVNFDRLDYGGGDTYYSAGFLSGKVGKSTDNGVNWTDSYTSSELLIGLSAYDENHVMTGGTAFKVYYSTNGGGDWNSQTLNSGAGDLASAGYFDQDTAYVAGSNKVYKTTDGCTTWIEDTAIAGTIHRAMFVTPNNVVFLGGDPTQIWRKIGIPPLTVDFEADDTEVCTGSTVNYTDLSVGSNISSWSWTFEGGTPSSSTDQNPSVTYNTPGTYNVSLMVTDDNGSNTKSELDYITVLETPATPDTPSGEADICTDSYHVYTTNEVLYAAEYEWELSPASAGTLEENGNEANMVAAEDWTGDFTITVRASNMCGTSDWAANFEGTIYQSPDEFNIMGGGAYCLDGDGVEITLDGSQTGIDYELLLDDVATGNIVAGTGSEISFGLITEEGTYTVEASNGVCLLAMGNEAVVSILNPPAAPGTPAGPTVICTEITSDYTSTGIEGADSYEWAISPEEAGILTANGLELTVEWDNEFMGTAMISLFGMNDCGDGASSEALEVSVGAPHPTVEGEEMACDWSEEFYMVTETEGNTYAWEVTGGTITEGQGTHMITVAWNGEGMGTIIVEEATADGCAGSSDQFDVVIDDCTVIDENAVEGLKIYPNPATSQLNITFIAEEDQDGDIIIYNNVGQIMMSQKIIGNTGLQTLQFNTSNLAKGVYLMKIQSGENSIATRRFIKN